MGFPCNFMKHCTKVTLPPVWVLELFLSLGLFHLRVGALEQPASILSSQVCLSSTPSWQLAKLNSQAHVHGCCSIMKGLGGTVLPSPPETGRFLKASDMGISVLHYSEILADPAARSSEPA